MPKLSLKLIDNSVEDVNVIPAMEIDITKVYRVISLKSADYKKARIHFYSGTFPRTATDAHR